MMSSLYMVKCFVSDNKLCQPVLVVWPGRTADSTMEALRKLALNKVAGSLAKRMFLRHAWLRMRDLLGR